MLAQIRIDTMFIGVNALNATDGAGTHDESEASISSRLIERSTRVERDRKSTRLNSSHVSISYAVFCLKKKKRRAKRETGRHHVTRGELDSETEPAPENIDCE